jgi:hypothetical protein
MLGFGDDYGSIVEVATEIIDCGEIPSSSQKSSLDEDDEEEDLSLRSTFSYCSSGTGSALRPTGKSKTTHVQTQVELIDLNEDSIVFLGIILTWIGFGTLFEMDNGLERTVSPYLASGTVR